MYLQADRDREGEGAKIEGGGGGEGGKQERRFIIRDLQCQIQSIKEKNTNKYKLFYIIVDL